MQPAARIEQRMHFGSGSNWQAFAEIQMNADSKARHLAGRRCRGGTVRAIGEQRSARDYAITVRVNDAACDVLAQ